ncbi:mechanosensitive ion channel [bacterium]|nr:mechanosensitive ion channel [bacterium]
MKNFFTDENSILYSPIFNKLVQTLIILVLALIIAKILNKIVEKNVKGKKKLYQYKKVNSYIINISVFVLVLMLWFSMVKSLAIVISIISVGVALALQEVLVTIAAFFLIVFKKPYEVGDRIEIKGTVGDIIDIDMYHTTILEVGNWVNGDLSTGRIVKIPNSEIFKNNTYNYNTGWRYIWDEMSIVITFDSDYKKAEKILLKVIEKKSKEIEENVHKELKKISKKYLIIFNILSPKLFVKIASSGIELHLRYLAPVKERRFLEDYINRQFLDKIAKEDSITLAYTTYRIIR